MSLYPVNDRRPRKARAFSALAMGRAHLWVVAGASHAGEQSIDAPTECHPDGSLKG